MARKRTPTLTDGELRLMNIIWDKGEATVSDVLTALPKSNRLAYDTCDMLKPGGRISTIPSSTVTRHGGKLSHTW